MIVSMIVAVSENGVIGREGQIPWDLPADLRNFKRLTMGHHLIVGRKTWESIGRPLPGRTMIVLSRKAGFKAEGCLTAASLPEAIEIAEMAGDAEAFIAGGSRVYEQAIPLADRIYLSRVHANVRGDTLFPEFNEKDWKVSVEVQYPKVSGQRLAFTFMILDRKRRK
ncbi:MAG: dihydrofolate reductase [Anaerolineales bacterium]